MTVFDIPGIEPRTPLCTICGDETVYEDEWYFCEPCGAHWDGGMSFVGFLWENDESGSWRRCVSTATDGTDMHRCIRDDGHVDHPGRLKCAAVVDGKVRRWSHRCVGNNLTSVDRPLSEEERARLDGEARLAAVDEVPQ